MPHQIETVTLTPEQMAEAVVDLTARVDDTPVIEAPPTTVQVMVDIETWGKGNDAVPVSLAAVKFTADEILGKFHVAIDPRSSELFGLKIDADTILWWFDPERDEARKRWLSMDRIDLPSALDGFSLWLNEPGEIVGAVWGNGATFDNVILRSAYQAAGLVYPLLFWQDQCYRTLKYRAPEVEIIREGTHHDALDDAISQAKHLQAIIRVTGLTL